MWSVPTPQKKMTKDFYTRKKYPKAPIFFSQVFFPSFVPTDDDVLAELSIVQLAVDVVDSFFLFFGK